MRWYEDLSEDMQEVVDQALHFGIGFLISVLAGPVVSVAGGALRELVQNWGDEDNNYWDMALDLFVWSLGAVAASLVF